MGPRVWRVACVRVTVSGGQSASLCDYGHYMHACITRTYSPDLLVLACSALVLPMLRSSATDSLAPAAQLRRITHICMHAHTRPATVRARTSGHVTHTHTHTRLVKRLRCQLQEGCSQHPRKPGRARLSPSPPRAAN